ncbi:stationary phase inducible protein CsiE [Klebsiella sp. RIT-PI-d]|uniref:stationary phase inducible protein CsiE n=1 Tax=Klebsiella sp. RIT-PI-d TaxID=1681196 RepID=UPI00092D2FD0|nr:stationary phase inducible protein CsiE [Klebsiella sp. RIT-PI-d]
MMTLTDPPSVLSSPQRRCQVLLMLSLPGDTITAESIGRVNNVESAVTRQDIDEANHEIQRYYRLTINAQPDGSYRIEGTPLDQRLCLLHWLRRALRLCPHFIEQHFTPALKTQMKVQGVARTLYDETNLQALVNLCARRLEREFECRDRHFLRLYLQYCLLQQQLGLSPEFNPAQQLWTEARAEYLATTDVIRHWQRRVTQTLHANEHLFLSLLFMVLRTPDPQRDAHQQDSRLRLIIRQLIHNFQLLAGRQFSDEQGLSRQLYIHLVQALDRSVFGIGIDNSLPEEVNQLYPRLMRTTREALHCLEENYDLQFTDNEAGLIAVIFGAWLMQENDLHEKQVLLLTGGDPVLEQDLELQLRELTLLPLNIKYLTLHAFQKQGAPKEVTLVVTPYVTTLPLFSPPLIHAEQPLSVNQREHIQQMLEA